MVEGFRRKSQLVSAGANLEALQVFNTGLGSCERRTGGPVKYQDSILNSILDAQTHQIITSISGVLKISYEPLKPTCGNNAAKEIHAYH